MMKDKPTMHCQAEIEADHTYNGFLPDNLMLKWFEDRYSTSKHLLTLYSLARNLGSEKIVEIGFGRSSFVLAKAAALNNCRFITCDQRDFSYLLNEQERGVTEFVNGKSDIIYENPEYRGIDFAFLDYFSSERIGSGFVSKEIMKCVQLMKTNGIIAIHDTIIKKYSVSRVLNQLKTTSFGFHNKKFEILSMPYNYGLGLIRVLDSNHGIIEDQFIKKPEIG